MKKFKFLLGIVALVVLMALVPVPRRDGPASALAQAPEFKGTVRFWTTERSEQVLEVLPALFTWRYPDVQIEIESVDEFELWKLEMAGQAGQAPDVAAVDLSMLSALVKLDAVDIKATQEIIDELGEDSFSPGALTLVEGPDGSVAVPFYSEILGLWYRQDLFDEYNLAPPTTADAILEAAAALHDPDADRYGIIAGALNAPWYTQMAFEQFGIAQGVHFFDSQGGLDLDTAKLGQAAEMYRQLVSYGPVSEFDLSEALDYFVQGRTAMLFHSSGLPFGWMPTDFESEEPGPIDFLPEAGFVGGLEGVGFGDLTSLVVFRDVSDRELAKEWVMFLLTLGTSDFLMARPGSLVPVWDQSYEPWVITELPGIYPADLQEEAFKAAQYVQRWDFVTPLVDPKFAQWYREGHLGTLLNQMAEGTITPDDFAKLVQEQLEEVASQIEFE